MQKFAKVVLWSLAVLLLPVAAFAQEAGGGGGDGAWGYALGAGLAIGLAGLGCGIGQGLTAGRARLLAARPADC